MHVVVCFVSSIHQFVRIWLENHPLQHFLQGISRSPCTYGQIPAERFGGVSGHTSQPQERRLLGQVLGQGQGAWHASWSRPELRPGSLAAPPHVSERRGQVVAQLWRRSLLSVARETLILRRPPAPRRVCQVTNHPGWCARSLHQPLCLWNFSKVAQFSCLHLFNHWPYLDMAALPASDSAPTASDAWEDSLPPLGTPPPWSPADASVEPWCS